MCTVPTKHAAHLPTPYDIRAYSQPYICVVIIGGSFWRFDSISTDKHCAPHPPAVLFLQLLVEINDMDRVMGLIDPAYRLENYRRLYEDPRCLVVLPVLDMIDEDTSLLPPRPVNGQSGRPKRGPPPAARIPSRGQKAASASNNVRMSSLPGAAPGAAGLSQGAGGLSQGAGALSQGALSQGASIAPINIG